MKRKLAMAMTAVLVLSAGIAGCGNKDKNTSAGAGKKTAVINEEKKEGDTFTLGFDASFPPYGYKDDDGEYVGFDLDLAQEVCERNGWELEKQPIDWDAKDMELNAGTIDCIWNGFTLNGREDEYTWSEPYVDNSQVVVVSEDSGIKSFDDLAGKIVEVQADSSALKALEGDQKELAGTFGNLTQVPDYNTAFMDLEAGSAEAVAMDIGVADYQIESRGGGYVILKDAISSEQYAVGFRKGNEKLKDQVQKTLDEMAGDGTLMSIAEKWGVEDAVTLGK
ncbi:amino acid ABC transporter substrate-binding protein [Clostridium sp. C105KSO13]|uniref:amino acid ABC transporter substrate-binding protein n=1 Tax=Clostridium sp. C105KSO13 TaxID=1776045 RepID=UPI0007405C7C|nr:amino acid ABC transporter substrate-binding protein [Clostridium sp. C105KSO13]CUX27668.1 Cystine-binding periplasmic protein precursor [Clostridium sp. C105KSO13]